MAEERFSNIGQLLAARVAQDLDKELLVSEVDGRRFTYSEVAAEVRRAADQLSALGVQKGDRVSLYLTNSVDYLFFYFACFELGAWAGPVNALLKREEVEFILSNSEASVVVTEPALLPQVEKARDSIPSLQHILAVVGGRWSVVGKEAPSPTTDHRPPTTDDEAVIIYTSGTTGKPKGVLLTHGNLLTNAREIAEWLRLTQDDRSLLIMPLFHVNALMTTALAALWAGGSIVLAERFSASRHWQMISQYGVTYFGSVATMLSLLIQTYPEGVPEGCDISRLRFALCGSAPVPVEVLQTYERRFGCPVIEGYGLSESSCRSTFNPVDGRRRPGSIGLPIGNEVRIFDKDDHELGPGAVGEIVLRGANIMKGYYRNEEANEKAFRSGWFHTGDLGYRDADGFFFIVDRKSDMIIRGGENIYPREIDELLYRHPKIKDAATVGVPDPLFGEEVKTFVVVKEGESTTAEEIIAYCRAHLADFKCPKTVAILDDIPKGPTGKLLKKELRELS